MRRTKEEAEQTRQALLDAAERVFLEYGVANATLAAIAREAKVTRGALYWHFRNKTDHCAAMLERVQLPLEAIQAKSDEIARDNPAAALEAFSLAAIRRAANDPQVRRVYTIVLHRRDRAPTHDPLLDSEAESRRRARQIFLPYFRMAGERGELRGDVAPETAAFALEAYIIGLFYLWLLPSESPGDWSETAGPLIRGFLAGYLDTTRQQPQTPQTHPAEGDPTVAGAT
jgi:AcrR family transcriptional regulator